MSGIGSKLSRHVLGMKFMRKTKAQIDGTETKAISSPLSTSASSSVKSEPTRQLKNEPNNTTSSDVVIEELWSYNQCEHYIFGRQSFGGFNPAVEKNVRKGLWRPFYLEEGDLPNDSSDDDDEKKHQSDVDVSDEEMAKTYGSIIGTLAKRFNKRNQKGNRGNKSNTLKGKGKDTKPKWNNRKKDNKKDGRNRDDSGNHNQKRQRESTGSTYQQQSPSAKRNRENFDEGDVPPLKKRKFLKPSD